MRAPSADTGTPDTPARRHGWRRSQDNTLQLTRDLIACVVRASDEVTLHEAICRVIVERGGYPLAAVFTVQPEQTALQLTQAFGSASAYLCDSTIRLDAVPSPTGLHLERIAVSRDLQDQPQHAYWQERARRHGLHAQISIPLKVRNQVRWLLLIGTDRTPAFDAVEVDLLERLADDMASGFDALRTRQERDAAMQLAQQATQRLELATQGAGIGIWEYTPTTTPLVPRLRWDVQTHRLFGHPPDTALAPDQIAASALGPELYRLLQEQLNHCLRQQRPFEMELPVRLPDGRTRWLSTRAARAVVGGVGLSGVFFDITAQVQARDTLRELATRRENAREDERRHIAREIHDDLGQMLGSLRLRLATLLLQAPPGSEVLQQQLEDVVRLSEESIRMVRTVVSRLRTPVLDAGIVPGLEWLINDFQRSTGLIGRLTLSSENIRLPDDIATALFRIAQESLTNVSRHAQARRVDIALTQRPGECQLEIRDDGRGFDPAQQRAQAFGLAGMRERSHILGGRFEVRSRPGKGTVIQVRIPLMTQAPLPGLPRHTGMP